MHPNPIYRTRSREENLRFAARVGFGVFCLSGGDGPPVVAQAPYVIEGDALFLHLMRSNPVTRALREGGRSARLVVLGPHGYISPDWYGVEDQVPTWNYVSVEVTGQLALLEEAQMRPVLDHLSENFEVRLAPKPVWRSDKMTAAALDRMMRSIVPLRMGIETVEGTWKLSQNKSDDLRHGAVAGLQQASLAHPGYGADAPALAALMRADPAAS